MIPTTATSSDTAPGRAGWLRPWEPAFLVGVPAAWAAVLVLHPTGEEFYPTVSDRLAAWQVVHLAMVAFIPLMALVILRLIHGLDGTAARISRMALPVFVVVYGVFEAILGIGMGLLVAGVDDLPASDRATGATLVDAYADSPLLAVIEAVASLSFGVALVAAAVALRRAELIGTAVVVVLVVAAPLVAIHAPPFGPVGLGLFLVGVVTVLRSRAAGAPDAPAAPPAAVSVVQP